MLRISEKKPLFVPRKLEYDIKWLTELNYKQVEWIVEWWGSIIHYERWLETVCDPNFAAVE